MLIGDHVWLGQSSFILKDTTIGSGSIVGAMGVVAGKTIPSNTSWAGNPAKQIASDIFWDGRCVHSWTKTETAANQLCKSRNYIYKQEGPAIGLRNLADELHGADTALERANLCEKHLLDNSNPNRFAINATAADSSKGSKSPFRKILKSEMILTALLGKKRPLYSPSNPTPPEDSNMKKSPTPSSSKLEIGDCS